MDLSDALLGERVDGEGSYFVTAPGLVAFPCHWQMPAATEKAAYEAMAAGPAASGWTYLGFPWATVIDGVRSNAPPAWEVLQALGRLPLPDPTPASRRCTVAQHIHADRFIGLFKAAGITDLFWPHATKGRPEIEGVRVHPFPLFPAQTHDIADAGEVHRPRRWLANFIGAYNPKVYLTDVREHIFADAGKADDLLIVKRDTWHFDRAVYAEQMKGVPPDAARLTMERRFAEEYLQALRDSTFTLCPTGSGPNSIRIGEALAMGSIPVILTRDLLLPGDPALWGRACLIEEDSAEGYRRALTRMRAMPAEERSARQVATQRLYAGICPSAWGQLIRDTLAAAAIAGFAHPFEQSIHH